MHVYVQSALKTCMCMCSQHLKHACVCAVNSHRSAWPCWGWHLQHMHCTNQNVPWLEYLGLCLVRAPNVKWNIKSDVHKRFIKSYVKLSNVCNLARPLEMALEMEDWSFNDSAKKEWEKFPKERGAKLQWLKDIL